MRLTIAYSKIKKQNLVLINNDTYQRETLSELPIRQPLNWFTKQRKLARPKSILCSQTSGVARVFPGGRLAHPEGQNEEENR